MLGRILTTFSKSNLADANRTVEIPDRNGGRQTEPSPTEYILTEPNQRLLSHIRIYM